MDKLQIRSFGTTAKGEKAYAYTMKNDAGMEVVVSDFGATLLNVVVPDKENNLVEVTLGSDAPAGYEASDAAMGASVGRNANRIGGAEIEINGVK